MNRFRFMVVVLLLSTKLFATYKFDDPTLGNIALEVGVWNTNINGDIINTISSTDMQKDLGFTESQNITSFGLDLKNDIFWLPNIYVNYFTLSNTSDSNLNSSKKIGDRYFKDSVSTSIDYTELNTILYGFLQQNIFEFDLGLNIKQIDYTQNIIENGDMLWDTTIVGPQDLLYLPYVALKIDLNVIDTVLKVEASLLSIGDDEAKDYKYSINYRVMRNMYLSYGYRYSGWKSTSVNDKHEKYNINVDGNYFNIKVLF